MRPQQFAEEDYIEAAATADLLTASMRPQQFAEEDLCYLVPLEPTHKLQ